MSETTPRFVLPLLAAGQAQKELFHNEALTLVEALLHPAACTIGDVAPPTAPQPGQSWIVGASPTGAWAGHADALATWTDGGWRFSAPVEGMAVWIATLGLSARFAAGMWAVGTVPAARIVVDGAQVVGARGPAIPSPAGGAIIDDQARAAIGAVLAALRGHGLIAS